MKNLLIFLCFLVPVASSHAQIKVAIHDSGTTAAGMDARPEGVKVTAAETWNNPVGQTVSSFALSDAAGSATTARLSYSAGFLKENAIGWESQSKDWVMMEAWVGFRSNESLTVSNLPVSYAAGYSVVIYGDSNDGGTRTMGYFVNDGSSTKSGTILDAGYFNGSFSSDKTVTITGLTGTSFTLTGNAGGSDARSAISGFEIIPGSVPVISSFSTNDQYVQPGVGATLSWSVSNATTLTLNPGNINVTGSTSYPVDPGTTTTYTLTASSGSESATAEVKVGVGPARPNILLVLVDDYGITDTSVPFVYDKYDDTGVPVITAFNNFHQTPNMEAMASRGMKFTRAYAMPMCSPTRASLMTGNNTPRHGITHHLNVGRDIDNNSFSVKTHRGPNNWRYNGMDASDVTLPKLLGAEGYRTIHCGKWHLGALSGEASYPTNVGFDINIAGDNKGSPSSYTGNYGNNLIGMDEYENTGRFLTDAITQALNAEIEQSVADGVPFFGHMSYFACHTPFTTNPDATGDYSAAVSTNHQKFATMVEGVDISLGDIIAKMTELGVADDTLIFFVGDNGSDSPALTDEGYQVGSAFDDFPMRGKKGSAYEGGTRVPLLVSWAANDTGNSFQQSLPITGGSVEHDLVTVEDIVPSILAAADVQAPAMDGYDLSAYLRSESGTHRPQKILRHMPHEHRSNYFVWFREGDWKLIYRFDSNLFELYDLASDPDESQNLAGAQPTRVMTMARAMARELDASWGVYGKLWPTHNPTQAATPARPLVDDPFSMPSLPGVDIDLDGLADNSEDPNNNGLVDSGETNPDLSDSDEDGSPDGLELGTGSDPLDSSSSFVMEIDASTSGTIDATWPSIPGRDFLVEGSDDLDGWDILDENYPAAATGSTTSLSVELPEGADRYFIRITVNP